MSKTRQQGNSLVEMSLTLTVMMALVLAILEFSLAMFLWARAAEATRVGARFAAVSTPATDLSSLNCTDSESHITVNCSDGGCDDLLDHIRGILPEIQPGNLQLTYECTRTGNPDRSPDMIIPEIRVSLQNMEYQFLTPALLGVEPSISLPSFTSTHTGEDLFSPATGAGEAE